MIWLFGIYRCPAYMYLQVWCKFELKIHEDPIYIEDFIARTMSDQSMGFFNTQRQVTPKKTVRSDRNSNTCKI